MATTVASHSVATFTSPVNGTTPIDANTVRGNDNTIRTAYNTHDADPGIHVQSSTLASRPVAGTAGRKWITEDDGIYTLWYDDGTYWHQVSQESLALSVIATQTLAVGDVVKAVGWNNGQNKLEVAKVSSASDTAFGIATEAITINTQGYVVNTGIVQDVNTAAYTVGTILYPNTSGGLTSTKPTSGNYQPSVYVLRQNVNNGVLYVEFSAPRIVESSSNTASTVVLRDASGNFSAGTITASLTGSISGNAATATALQTARNINGVSFNGTADITVTAAAGTLTGNTLASGVTASSLTSVGTLSSLTVSGNVTVDTNTLFVDAANNRVGIGMVSPDSLLSLAGGAATTFGLSITPSGWSNARHRLTIPTSGDTSVWSWNYSGTAVDNAAQSTSSISVGNGALLFATGTTNTAPSERVRIDASGNVGIGTSSPVTKLDVAGSFGTSTTAVTITNASVASASNIAQMDFRLANTFGGIERSAAIWGINPNASANNGGALVFATSANGTSTTPAERARIDSSGNLGLGVTPSAWNTSFKALEFSSGYVAAISTNELDIGQNNFYSSSLGNWAYKNSAGATQYRQTGSEHRWFTAPSGTAGAAITFTQAMTLDANGVFMVGTVSAGTGHKLRVGDTNGTLSYGAPSTGSGRLQYEGGPGNIFYIDVVNSSGAIAFRTENSGLVERARITTGGDVGFGTSSPAARFEISGAMSVNPQQYITNTDVTVGSKVAGLYFYSRAASNGWYSGIDAYVPAGSPGVDRTDLRFYTTNATVGERMRIKNTGQVRFVPLAAAPGGAENGDVYYDSGTNKLRVYAGGAWVDLH